MPIVNLYLNKPIDQNNTLDKLVDEWSKQIDVSTNDIVVNVITSDSQHGRKYGAMANLYLPSIWKSAEIATIQKTLSSQLEKHLILSPDEVFIITSIISSGHVLSNGKVEVWE